MDVALTVTCGEETILFDDDELCALSEMNFLYGTDGAKVGRLLVTKATISDREVRNIQMFIDAVRAKLDEPLVVYDHGHGSGTVCFQHRPWYDLVKRSGARYEKQTPRYVKGEKGKLESIDPVVYVRGRSVRDTAAKPQKLREITPLTSALEKLARAVAMAGKGPSLVTAPRQTYEYF